MRADPSPEFETPPPARAHRPLWRALAALAGLMGLTILLGSTALALAARWHWAGEVAANFRWQLGWGGALAAVLLLLGRRRWLALAAGGVSLAHLAPVLLLWAPADRAPAAPTPSGAPCEFTVAESNLLYSNANTADFLAWVERDPPDVLALLEISALWRPALERLSGLYPHRLLSVDHVDPWACSVFGIGLFSRHPLEDARAWRPDPHGQDVLEAWVRIGGERLHVVAFHTLRPGRADSTAKRNAQLDAIARSSAWGGRSIVLGDFNCTLYSPVYADFLARTGLAEARRGFGRLPTWRSRRWVEGLWLDLDHILAGGELEVLDCRTGPPIGSDHLPLVARLRVPARPAPAP